MAQQQKKQAAEMSEEVEEMDGPILISKLEVNDIHNLV